MSDYISIPFRADLPETANRHRLLADVHDACEALVVQMKKDHGLDFTFKVIAGKPQVKVK